MVKISKCIMASFIFFYIMLAGITVFAATHALRMTPLPGTVTLLFDDGPHPSLTPKVLAILKQHHVKANFSLIGYRAQRYPDIVKQIIAHGNVLLMHTLRHLDLQNATPQTIRKELLGTQSILKKITGKTIYCLQPPFMRKSHKLAVIASQYDMLVIPKAYDSYDSRNISVSTIVTRVMSVAHSGAIINVHDTNTRLLLALPEIINKIRAKGLGFSMICVPQK